MSVPTVDVQRAIDMAHQLEQQGYFAKAKSGDERGASYFARMVAARVNPSGNSSDWGWLKKTGAGFNVEGYADGAIVFGNDPANRTNVLKIVTQIGSTNPNAIQIGDAVQERRAEDIWDKPVPLPDAITSYLLPGGVVIPPSVPPHADLPGRQEMMEAGQRLHFYYRSPEGLQRPNGLWKPETQQSIAQPDWEGIGAWLFDVYLKARVAGKNATDAMAEVVSDIRHSAEWQQKHPGETP